VLAYFKETKMKETGQRHFLPVIMDGKMLYQQAAPPPLFWQMILELQILLILIDAISTGSPSPPLFWQMILKLQILLIRVLQICTFHITRAHVGCAPLCLALRPSAL